MEIVPGKTCCRKALVFGLFFGASVQENKIISAEFSNSEVAEGVAAILTRQFSAAPQIEKRARAGRYFYCVTARSKAVSAFLQSLDDGQEQRPLGEIVEFKCEDCAHAFLRGVFIAMGHINDPKKSYHLEFSVGYPLRAKRLAAFLCDTVAEPKYVERNGKAGVYYKRNMLITDLLYYLGALKKGFEYSDTCIENDIRNRENRATNCVASNILRSVAASQKHIDAIEELTRTGRLFKLPEEIRYTARLRIENPAANLSELARLHEPPISKSGLNRRLNRILEELQ